MFHRVLLGIMFSGWALVESSPAQQSFSTHLLPPRAALERLGLERYWYGVMPMAETEQLLSISFGPDLVFVQTNYAMLHAFDPESGRLLWSTRLGEKVGYARGVASNSREVFVTNATILHALDKQTGRMIWQYDLSAIPTSPPAASEDYVVVGLASGLIQGIKLIKTDSKGVVSLLTKAEPAFRWTSAPPVTTRPIIADRELIYTGSDGLVHIVMKDERTVLFRFKTGGRVGEGFGVHDTRTLLIPSADNVLYAVDLFSTKLKWAFASGAPILQAPMVADDQVFVINESGELSEISIKDGQALWTLPTSGGRLASASPTKLYLRSENLDLFTVDRKTGRIIASPNDTYKLAGVDLREYELDIVNRFNDRLYFATKSGMLICLRESGLPQPRLLRDPKEKPFGYVPPEGIKPDRPKMQVNTNVDLTVNPEIDPNQGAGAKPPATQEEKPQ